MDIEETDEETEIEDGENPRHIELRGSPEGSASFVDIEDDGSLVAEWYDYGSEAESGFGGDVAFLVRLTPSDKDILLLQLLLEKFENWSELKKWFKEHQIPFTESFDPYA